MGVGEDFRTLCDNLAVPATVRTSISGRYGLITRRLNIEFWTTDSSTSHSFYTGSYGRGTAVGSISDVDMIFQLPYAVYTRCNAHEGNGKSALLQEIRRAIQKTYATTNVGADGQVVGVPFNDGITFEVLPGFVNDDGSYTFPDSNAGGSWKTTNPKPEIDEFAAMDNACNGNLKMLCRMARAWKITWDVPISGLLIDTLAYYFIRNSAYKEKSFVYYDWVSRDFFDFLRTRDEKQQYWLSPGANQYVWNRGLFQYKATRCHNISVAACSYQGDKYGWTARQKWREIYGTDFPAS
jgi:Second Messenger Oligonucleotide or Dinucleotide Synthetase domain